MTDGLIDKMVEIMLDNLTLLNLQIKQLEQNKPRPDNHYELLEKLITDFNNCRDRLIEELISRNIINLESSMKGKPNK